METFLPGDNAIAKTPVYDILRTLYRESSGYRDETLTARTIDDIVQARTTNDHPTQPSSPLLMLSDQGEPETIMGARVTPGSDGYYLWHLSEVKSEPLLIASRELRNSLSRFGRLDLERQYQVDIIQADALLKRDRWRLVEAVTDATSIDDLSDRLGALIAE